MNNKNYSVIIVEDEEPAVDYIATLIQERPELAITGKAGDGRAALSLLAEGRCDILFLDIDLPLMTGIEVLEGLKERPYVVVTTAFHSFVEKVEGFGVEDILMKPFSRKKFNAVVDRACRALGSSPG